MTTVYDYLIVGAGPAGMAAAIEAADASLSVLVLDQGSSAGGQIYRHLEKASKAQLESLGADYAAGKPLLAAFKASFSHSNGHCKYIAQAQVWHLESHAEGFLVAANINGVSQRFFTTHLLLANGAMERPMAIEGWQKPGVMTAGGGQILLKSSGLLPKRVVLAGSGPLLLLLAQQYRAAGVTITALIDTTPAANYLRAAPWLLAGLTMPKQLFKGLWLTLVQRIKVPYFSNVTQMEILGKDHATGVRFTASNKQFEIPTNLVMLHQGIVPQTPMAQLLGCELEWHKARQCWQSKTDVAGFTSVKSVQVAGDAGAVGGAQLAQLQGQLAALSHIAQLSKQVTLKQHWLRFRVYQLQWARLLVDWLYHPAQWLSQPTDNTIVCRCEQVSAGEVRRVARAGCGGVNQLKAFTRAGMGPCQARQCGLNLGYLVAQAQGRPMDEVEPLTVRPPLSPVTLGEMANTDRAS